MNTRAMPNTQIGVKLGGLFYDLSSKRSILSSFDKNGLFFEYQAPRLCLEDIADYHGLDVKQLRPHSVLVSTATDKMPASSIIQRLAHECALTDTPYLAEHIGYLNTNPHGSSLGYLIAPALNQKIISQIITNIAEMQKAITVPIALENCVFYAQSESDELNLAEFIGELAKNLPKNVGWLIDYAHLEASCLNLGNITTDEVLAAYAGSGRRLYEVHIANTFTDRSGITHDDHNTPLSDSKLVRIFSQLRQHRLHSSAITVERNIENLEDIQSLAAELESVRALASGSLISQDIEPDSVTHTVSSPLAKIAEHKGRIKILQQRLLNDLQNIPTESLNDLAANLGCEDFSLLVGRFYSEPFHPAHEEGLPQFSAFESDQVDALTPFYLYIQDKHSGVKSTEDTLREMLFEIAIRQAVVLRTLTTDDIKIVLSLTGDAINLEKGLYHITVNQEWDVEAENINDEFIKINEGTIALFCEKGGISWPRKSVSSDVMSKLLLQNSEMTIHTNKATKVRGAG